ncbi:MAG: MmcQ/YjbR family DNA-binding protein [Ilumatobacteraceae bacterium]
MLRCPAPRRSGSHGAPSFFAGKQFAAVRPDGHHDRTEPHLVCAAPPGVQQELIDDEPGRFFRPPYVGGRGWIGVLLTGDVEWDEIGRILAEAHATVTS